MLALFFAERYEKLVQAFELRFAQARRNPLEPVSVIVPTAGVRRQLELTLAKNQGVASGLAFDFLGTWLWRQVNRLVDVGEYSPYAPGVLLWQIDDLLRQDWVNAYPRLANYLAAADAGMRYELSARLARLFDHYITYRPHWLARWAAHGTVARFTGEAVRDEAWQAHLWRVLNARMRRPFHGAEHPVELFFGRLRRMTASQRAAVLPQRAYLFCLPSIPPLYLMMLMRLTAYMDIHLYLLNPCREYWLEVVPPRMLTWLKARQRDLYHESGNSLLANWGRQTQACLDLLLEVAMAGEAEVEDAFDDGDIPQTSVQHSLLRQLQSAIFTLREMNAANTRWCTDDRSIEVHICHSLTRELEVLQDRILDWCSGPEALLPQEIVVVTPDLPRAAPLIESVFAVEDGPRRLPWRITGLGQLAINPVAGVLDRVLQLMSGRFPVSAVFELMQLEPVAQCFALDDDALQCIHDWLQSGHVHWGLGAGQRQQAADDPVRDPRYSFADGVNRLFLAYACAEDDDLLVAGIAPLGNPEGEQTRTLGSLWRFTSGLEYFAARCRKPMDAAQWRDLLLQMLDFFIPPQPQWLDGLSAVQRAIGELYQEMTAEALQPTPDLQVMQQALRGALENPVLGAVPSGAVCFTTMSGLRNLNYRAVCVIGLDADSFPAADRADEFDLIARYAERGDRQRRYDDCNIFLDLLLAARDYLHLSYVGRSIRDNSVRSPSALIDELLDYLAPAIAGEDASPDDILAARQKLCVCHPLQPFSESYFDARQRDDSRLYSFHSTYAQALTLRRRTVNPVVTGETPFFIAALPDPAPQERQADLDQLARFFRNPARAFVHQRLGLRLAGQREGLEDDEIFVPEHNDLRRLGGLLLPRLLRGDSPESIRAWVDARRELPHSGLGDYSLERTLPQLADFAGQLRERYLTASGPVRVSTMLDVALDDQHWQLAIVLDPLQTDGQLFYDAVPGLTARRRLDVWIRHLALCAVSPDGVPCVTRWAGLSDSLILQPVADARCQLAQLLRFYRDGLCRPLPFFPDAAQVWMESRNLDKAQARWLGNEHTPFADGFDPYIQLVYRGRQLSLDDEFIAVAEAVLEPMLSAMGAAGEPV